MIQPRQVSIRSVATELGHKLRLVDFRTCFSRPFLDFSDAADVVQCNTLILIDKEDAAFRIMDDFHHLIFPQAME